MFQIHLTCGSSTLYGKVFDNSTDCMDEVIKLNSLTIQNGFSDLHYYMSYEVV